jgi:cyclic pyranopterin phosphate synthase
MLPAPRVPLLDTLGRPLASLRISVTDRCNLRCGYCMPEESYVWLPKTRLLTFEEIVRLVRVARGLGVEKVRLTGGEPLLRQDLPKLVRALADTGVRDLALTTNGLLLTEHATALRDAGLGRLTVSLDTLRPDRFFALTRRDALADVLAGIETARRVGFSRIKLDTVVLRGENDDELVDLVELSRRIDAEIRFIEYMDVGGATRWAMDRVVSRREVLDALERRYGAITPIAEASSAPAERFALPDGTTFGIIASTTGPFCRACDRSRLTADGRFFLCLYAREGLDLRALLRDGAPDERLADAIADAWTGRADRGAEQRAGLAARGPLLPAHALRRDPHLEMHTRGG